MCPFHGFGAGLDRIEHGMLHDNRAVALKVINVCVVLKSAFLVQGKGILIIWHRGEFNTVTAFRHGVIDQDLHHLASKPAVLELVEYAYSQ
jgi:hypothetical protein